MVKPGWSLSSALGGYLDTVYNAYRSATQPHECHWFRNGYGQSRFTFLSMCLYIFGVRFIAAWIEVRVACYRRLLYIRVVARARGGHGRHAERVGAVGNAPPLFFHLFHSTPRFLLRVVRVPVQRNARLNQTRGKHVPRSYTVSLRSLPRETRV